MPSEASQAVAEAARSEPTITYAISPLLATLADPTSVAAETIRGLRTHIMAQHVEAGRRALAVSAASVGVGCTYVATNLAVALSQIGLKTLLIDGNLREPGVNALIRPSMNVAGLQQYLAAGDDEFGGANVQHNVLPNLAVLYAGGPTRNAQELLAQDRFSTLMNSCLRDFEVTIIDTAPANMSSDARRIGVVAGYSLIVARRNQSRMQDLKTLVEQLKTDGAKVVGTVLNEF